MTDTRPVALVWLRNALRVDDNPVLQAALDGGFRPVPVYVHAPGDAGRWPMGAAQRAWLHRSLAALDARLRGLGSGLVLRSGRAQAVIERLVAESGAVAVYGDRRVEPAWRALDQRLDAALARSGVRLEMRQAALLFEPDAESVRTGQGTPYRVFTPFWKTLRRQWPQDRPLPAPTSLPPLPALATGTLADLDLAPRTAWDTGFWEHWEPGGAGAHELLDAFVEGAAGAYDAQRDLPDRIGTSRMSPHLHLGEISPRQILARLADARWNARQKAGIEAYERELAWREFSHHLLWHFPHMQEEDFNPRFARFAWAEPAPQVLEAWRHGRTGIPIVDAGMRELWACGWMHNRVRLIVGSVLTKNLRQHWLAGARWFWDTLVDADLANNSQNWQWIGGTGADAAPYFRIFNPVTQSERFDPHGRYIRQWMPELAALPGKAIHAPWTQPALLARYAPAYPKTPVVDLAESREAALDAFRALR
ncbi:cryptochrome/photolyase family protein [Coralloluteibacterium stylophorae]|uniref:Deoxyribodipyrimidine photo-lyase n=2 Tax=Coralloluteibacterium stylophorae TaxID=1776034 RepID=A0AAP2C8R6_9GAMM|nr:deoxyribodipyrimidine photo-lyase [Coralloluteibacterium stylophorae]MBS7455945.1 deoxyribodipyrimidine photo-lyase [Coralloluteibacterium stylophorae]